MAVQLQYMTPLIYSLQENHKFCFSCHSTGARNCQGIGSASPAAAYYQQEHEDKGYLEGLKAERAETEKALNNLVRAIEQGIFSETTQARLTELESRKKALTEAIDAEEIKRAITKHDISIQHFFDEYAHADLNYPAVRDYLLDYFIDKIFVYDDRGIMTIWYGDDKRNHLGRY